MKLKKELIRRDIAGETILVPVGKTVYETNGLFVLTELGAFIWDLLPKAESEKEILEAVLAEYEVEEKVASKDLEEFLQKLKEMEIL